ncbi:TPA: TcfC E-set like domain-containing protein [Photobacterium damselae]
MSRIYLPLFVSCLIGYSLPSAATDRYPLEFADFFETHPEAVEVTIAGSPRGKQLKANVSYDFFQIVSTPDNLSSLSEYLERQKLSQPAIKHIIKTLELGVPANPNCTNTLDSCVPKDIKNQAEFVFNFDKKILRIFVSSDMLKPYNTKSSYYDPITSHGALINWSNLYLYTDENNHTSNWLNNTLLGLPLGYLSVNTQYHYSDKDEDFTLFRALYSAEMADHRLLIGYQDQNALALNNTDFLNYGANYAGTSIALGTSQNLLIGDRKAQQRLYFFTPQAGQLEVYQNNHLLLSKVVNAGEQSIGYDEIPTGTYTITLQVKQGSNTVLKEQRQIVNSSKFSLPVGQWDYRLDSGLLDNVSTKSDYFNPISANKRYYSRLQTSYRVSESVILGSGITTNYDSSMGILGGYWSATNNISVQYSLGLFTSGDNYQFGQLTVAPFSFSVRSVEQSDLLNPKALVRLLYGDKNLKEYSAGVSGSLLFGRSFLNYFRYETEDNINKSVSDNVSWTWSSPLWGGELSINNTYSHYNDGRNNWNTGLSWRKSFGESISGQFGVNTDYNGLTSTQNNLSYNYTGDDYSGSTTAGFRWYQGDNTVGDISTSINGHTPYINYDAYGYANTSGSRSISTSISGSQILSSQGSIFTNTQGQSFVQLAPRWLEPTKKSTEVNYTALKNDRYWYSDNVHVGSTRLLNLPIYSEIDFDLDTESENIDSKKIDSRFFVTPGTYFQLANGIIPLTSQIFILNDMYDRPINNARCIGEGCKNLELLSENGVFRLNYRKMQPFKLISNKRLCVYNPELLGEKYINAYCLPGLDNSEQQLVKSDILPNSTENELIYIGKFNKDIVSPILLRLNQAGIASKTINIGKLEYVYIKYKKSYSIAQRMLIEDLNSYAIEDNINKKQLFTVR